MAKRTIGPFQLERRLGVGGMGVVYLATYSKTGQQVAVKVLSPAMSADTHLQRRFEREMSILKKLRHPHIVQYFGGGKQGNQHFYAMELVHGGSLEQVLKSKGRLSWEQTIDCAMQIAKALEHAHNHGIIHRDLKPANIFMTKKGEYKLGDFGIARDTQATALTAAGKTVGTYAYMAPEQISGNPQVSRKTDLYALGCVMFEMLAGHPPFQAESPPQMFMAHLQEEPPRVTSVAIDCPIWLESVVMKLLEKDPEERYYDALALQVALDEVGKSVAEQASIAKTAVLGGTTSTTSREQGRELKKILAKRKRRKKKGPFYEQVWFLVTCLALLVGAVTWLLWPLNDEQLFARAQPLMASEDSLDWDEARSNYLEPLLEKYPDSPHATTAREFIEKTEMHKAEQRALARARRGREPESEAERLFMNAREYETFGDRVSALAKYRGMVELLKNDNDARPFVNLARRQIAEIEYSEHTAGDSLNFVNERLQRADRLYTKGETIEATKIWYSVVTLYGSNRELQPQVNYAQARIDGKNVEPLSFEQPTSGQNGETRDDREPESQNETS